MPSQFSIRKFQSADAAEVAALVRKTLVISNVPDYTLESMEELAAIHTPEYIESRSAWMHFHVVCEGEKIVGCGAVGPHGDSTEESELYTVFVLPEYQGKGLGKLILDALEHDEYFLRAKRIVICASITARDFYMKYGYQYAPGGDILDEDDLYTLEKIR